MKFNRVFTLMENTEVCQDLYLYTKTDEDWGKAKIGFEQLTSWIGNFTLRNSYTLRGDRKETEELIRITKKNGKVDKTRAGDNYYVYSCIIPEKHEGLKLNDGKKVVFLYVDGEDEIRLFFDNAEKKSITELESMTKPILSKYKSTTLGKNEKENAEYPIGTVLYSSWGYDQTNVDFYVVVKSNEKTLWINEISSQSVEGSGVGNGMADEVTAGKIDPKNMKINSKTIQTRAKNPKGEYGYHLRIHAAGSSHYRSWYH